MMQLKQYTEDDHATLTDWWLAHGVAVVPHDALPATGAIALNEDGDPCAACFLYMDNSVALGLLAWPIVNPTVGAKDKLAGLRHCIDFITDHAANLGYTTLVSMSSVSSMSRLLERFGFKMAAINTEVLIKA